MCNFYTKKTRKQAMDLGICTPKIHILVLGINHHHRLLYYQQLKIR